jgi:hypothetical protein
MSDDFGLLNLASSPFLERIVREDRLNGDQPRRTRYQKPKSARKDPESPPSEDDPKTDDSTSSLHIDLRI